MVEIRRQNCSGDVPVQFGGIYVPMISKSAVGLPSNYALSSIIFKLLNLKSSFKVAFFVAAWASSSVTYGIAAGM